MGISVKGLLRKLEYIFWAAGIVLVMVFFAGRFSRISQAEESVKRFESGVFLAQVPAPITTSDSVDATHFTSDIDRINTDLWSDKRKTQYEDRKGMSLLLPEAVLYVDDLKLVVPVFPGAGEDSLSRGAGWIKSTTAVHEKGNIGLAAHRDSFFRPLKDIQIGQKIRIKTLLGERHFEVKQLSVVDPSQIEVLQPTPESRLTLVTCYPFYHVGKAPKRFIVSAVEVL